jgi:hypothetical protein
VSALTLALLISLLATACASSPTDAKPATRIMPLGDSITDGYQIPAGYRIDLWRELEDSGIDVDFCRIASQRSALARGQRSQRTHGLADRSTSGVDQHLDQGVFPAPGSVRTPD